MMIPHQTVGVCMFITHFWVCRETFRVRTPPHTRSCCLHLITRLSGEVKQGVLRLRVHSWLSKHAPVSPGAGGKALLLSWRKPS